MNRNKRGAPAFPLSSIAIAALLASAALPSHAIGAERFLERTEIDVATRPPLEGVLVSEPGKALPVVALLGGFETGKNAVDLVRDAEGFAFASLDYPYKQEQRKWTAGEIFRRGPELRRALHATREGLCPFLEQLEENPSVDRNAIFVLGASFGVPYALYAVNDCRTRVPIRALILVHGFGDIPGTIEYRMLPRFTRNYGPFFGPLFAKIASRFGWWALGLPTPEEIASRISKDIPILWIEARDDEMIPESSRRSLREALAKDRSKFEVQEMPGGHLHPGSTDLIRELIRRSERWLRKSLPSLFRASS